MIPLKLPTVAPNKIPCRTPSANEHPSQKPVYKYPSKKPIHNSPTKKKDNHQDVGSPGATNSVSSNSNNNLSFGAYVGIAIGAFVLMICVIVFYFFYMKKSLASKANPIMLKRLKRRSRNRNNFR